MNLLDTNSLSLLRAGNENMVRRVRENKGHVWLSSVAAEEFIVGRLNSINRARAPRTSLSLARAHDDFAEALIDLRLLPILTYSEDAEKIFQTFTPAQIRIGAQDCRIAAQALAHNLSVVTRNVRDFEAIGAPCADWSA